MLRRMLNPFAEWEFIFYLLSNNYLYNKDSAKIKLEICIL